MSYPFDQFTGLASANRQLFMKLLDIARSANERQAQVGAKVMAGFADQLRDPKTAATAPMAQTSECLKELNESRQTVLAEAKSAFEQWQAEAGELVSPKSGQKQMTLALQNWSRLVLAPFELLTRAGAAAASPAPAGETKTAKAAAPTTGKQG